MDHSLSRRTVLGGTFAGLAAPSLLPSLSGPPRLKVRVDWASFLGDQDLRWGQPPRHFYEAPFLGNGGLGAAAYVTREGRLAFTLGDNRVRDHQATGGASVGSARLRVGRFVLATIGEVVDVDLRLSLFDAELSGTVTTSKGTVKIRAYVHATTDLLVVDADAGRGERVEWDFVPFKAESTWLMFNAKPSGLLDNPDPVVGRDLCEQDLAAGGRITTAWRVGGGRLLATVAHTFPDRTATDKARRTLGRDSGLAEHRRWWHAYYPKSFVSIPDARLQSFYWIQLYKIASATRRGLPPLSTTGPWLEPTPWPAIWWNLNVQLEYWLIYATGHGELDSLTSSLAAYRDNLPLNVPEAYRDDSAGLSRTSQEDLRTPVLEPAGSATTAKSLLELGNLPWTLHNVWLAYRHTMDEALLRDLIYPLLRRAINYYLHFLTEGADGRLHLPRTFSPEYDTTSDCNFDLALITWGCRTLLWTVDRLDVSDDLAPRWREVLDKLVTPPQGPDGLWIGADRQLTSGHRHYSHLLWFYPLNQLDLADSPNRDLLERSLRHWVSFPSGLQGYTFTGAASMSAMLGDGDRALGYLDTLLDRFVKPNTMYAEAGPVIETPLSGAQSVHDLLISSRGSEIRIFPAIPAGWADVAFHNLRAEGAFEVSAVRRAGSTAFVRIKSLAGEPCRIVPNGLPGPWAVKSMHGREVAHRLVGDVLEIDLAAGQEALIFTEGARPDLSIAPAGAPYAWGKPRVERGRSTPIPLTSVLNHDAVTYLDGRADGDLGGGFTLPAEELPPAGPWRSGGIDWLIPSYESGQLNNLVPGGQRIDVPRGRAANVHVLGLSAGGSSSCQVTLGYADGTSQTVTLGLTDWGHSPEFGEDVAILLTYRHTLAAPGSQGFIVQLFHQTIPADSARELVSLSPAANSRMHIFAISLED
ncbi:glycosyl hydrolase family 95 catalytic domain-containing protein [Nonomuraea sp. CA-143628]|uniref:glycosyl hydrolase family 95 catalytic domain-containing protein n=1 Tax=Nonomuraea sp. CA-143628 TaxID=3239997 RepID=UPI003D924EF4